jgi:hypothetical protein
MAKDFCHLSFQAMFQIRACHQLVVASTLVAL